MLQAQIRMLHPTWHVHCAEDHSEDPSSGSKRPEVVGVHLGQGSQGPCLWRCRLERRGVILRWAQLGITWLMLMLVDLVGKQRLPGCVVVIL